MTLLEHAFLIGAAWLFLFRYLTLEAIKRLQVRLDAAEATMKDLRERIDMEGTARTQSLEVIKQYVGMQ